MTPPKAERWARGEERAVREGRGRAAAGCGSRGPGRPVPSGVPSWQAWPRLGPPRTSAASSACGRFPALFRTQSNSRTLDADVPLFKSRSAVRGVGNEAGRAAPRASFPPSERGRAPCVLCEAQRCRLPGDLSFSRHYLLTRSISLIAFSFELRRAADPHGTRPCFPPCCEQEHSRVMSGQCPVLIKHTSFVRRDLCGVVFVSICARPRRWHLEMAPGLGCRWVMRESP